MIKILYEDRKIIEEMYNSQVPLSRIAARLMLPEIHFTKN